jgi:ferritin-like metal-binding protein YciE
MSSLKTLDDLFLKEIRDLYSAENQILKALPKMAKKATSEALKEALNQHLEVTKGQVERLEKIFTDLGKSSRGPKCAAMEGLVEEGKELLEADAEGAVLDAGIIGACQRIEHYEMAGYGTARTLAQHLGLQEAADLLQETLDEEGDADKQLTELAETEINIEAEAAGEEEEEEVVEADE